jgi:hypothetical protein
MYQKLKALCAGAMKGRTLYVVPYLMGPPGSPLNKVGIELTDSIYVALTMRIVTRMGQVAYEHLGAGEDFNRGLHCMLDLDPKNRCIAHFPNDNAIISTSSNYGGNVLLGGVAGRAHAHPGRPIPRWKQNLRGRRFPERVRQDQPRHARAPAAFRRLEDSDPWRRHRLAQTRPRRTSLCHQS